MARPSRKRRSKGDSLVKYIYLNEGDVAYRLGRGSLSPEEYEKRLDGYYPELVALAEEKSSALRLYAIVFAACLLARYGVISEISAAGIKISLSSIKHVLLFGLAGSMCWFGITASKYNFVKSLFDRYMKAHKSQKKVDLLARYPRAFDFSDYYTAGIGNPPNLINLKTPWQLLVFAGLLITGLVFYIILTLWIFAVTAVDVWNAPNDQFGGWSELLVIICVSLAISVYAMPSASIFKRRYTHTGMITLLNRFMNNDKNRYRHFAMKVVAAERRMGLSDRAGAEIKTGE